MKLTIRAESISQAMQFAATKGLSTCNGIVINDHEVMLDTGDNTEKQVDRWYRKSYKKFTKKGMSHFPMGSLLYWCRD